uniref:Uncharacterized protein n=1 Tax=Oryza brachyantha TaxID=4533 RepID=J3NCE2_ORYBR
MKGGGDNKLRGGGRGGGVPSSLQRLEYSRRLRLLSLAAGSFFFLLVFLLSTRHDAIVLLDTRPGPRAPPSSLRAPAAISGDRAAAPGTSSNVASFHDRTDARTGGEEDVAGEDKPLQTAAAVQATSPRHERQSGARGDIPRVIRIRSPHVHGDELLATDGDGERTMFGSSNTGQFGVSSWLYSIFHRLDYETARQQPRGARVGVWGSEDAAMEAVAAPFARLLTVTVGFYPNLPPNPTICLVHLRSRWFRAVGARASLRLRAAPPQGQGASESHGDLLQQRSNAAAADDEAAKERVHVANVANQTAVAGARTTSDVERESEMVPAANSDGDGQAAAPGDNTTRSDRLDQPRPPLCDFSDHRSDVCELSGDIRMDANASSFFLVVDPASAGAGGATYKVRPYARKGDATSMGRVTEVTIVPWGGLRWVAQLDFGAPAVAMGLRYIQYEVAVDESTLKDRYPRDHEVFTNPTALHKRGFAFVRQTFLKHQDVAVDIRRFKPVLLQALHSLAAL